MPDIPPPREVADEFRNKPLGHHSPSLQHVLTTFRSAPMAGKYVLIVTKPHQEWRLGRLTGVRGEAPQPVGEDVFTDRASAEWAVFRRRWEEHFGEALPE